MTTETTLLRDPAEAAPAVLALRGITVAYPRPGLDPLTVVSDLDLTVRPGAMHCLAGRSGSGKTSVLRVAAGLSRPASGTVTWGTTDLAGLPDDAVTARRGPFLGYLDQDGALLPGLTALENVLLPAVPARRTRELGRRARDLLGRVGVADRADHRPEHLSGGERQRVALARALLLRPAALLADEPTSGLDRATADAVIELLRSLAADGVALLVASHDPGLIAAAGTVTRLE